MNKFRYKNIFLYSSLQFSGHIEEYFARHTYKLVVLVIMPRLNNKNNLIRVYEKGRLMSEKSVWSSGNIFLYYLAWLFDYWKILLTYFDKKEEFTVISFHPISFFGSSLQKRLRRVKFAFWIGDYFPPVNFSLRLFESLKKHYHDRVKYRYYLSNRLNNLYNHTIVDTQQSRTVMWGLKPSKITHSAGKKTSILFIGLIKESQGLELVFEFLRKHKNFKLNIIGNCDDGLYKKYLKIIHGNGIENLVFFPNRFYQDKELRDLAMSNQVGIAMYNTESNNATYYTDPGKIKSYLEMGLPVVMSETSAIAPFIKKFHCGEVVDSSVEAVGNAFNRIRLNYDLYLRGVHNFNNYFYYEKYYRLSFRALETV